MSRPPAAPPSPSRGVPGWMLVLIGLGILAVWLGALLLIAALGLPLGDGRRSGAGLLLLAPLAGLAIVVVGVVSMIRRKPLTFTSTPGGSPQYGALGRQIRARERAEREERRQLKAAQKQSREG